MISIGSKPELIENSFDICTTKFKLDIFAILFSWPVNPIDVDTLQMREKQQAEVGNALSIWFIEICGCWIVEKVTPLSFIGLIVRTCQQQQHQISPSKIIHFGQCGCGTGGRAIHSDSRGSWFESSLWGIFPVDCIEKNTKIKSFKIRIFC